MAASPDLDSQGNTLWHSAHLSWSYSGQDQPDYEFEQMDQSTGENFHYMNTIGSVPGLTSGTASGLVSGDTYLFRMRADFADGSVSDWSSPAVFAPALLTAPSASAYVATDSGNQQHIITGWSGAPAGGSVNIEVMGDSLPSSGWNVINDYADATTNYSVTNGSNNPLKQSTDQGCVQDFALQDSTSHPSGIYTYRVQAVAASGQVSAWSGPVSAGFGLSAGPTLTASHTATSMTVSFTGTAPGGGVTTGYSYVAVGTRSGNPDVLYRSASQTVGSTDASSQPTSQAVSLSMNSVQPGMTYYIVLIATPSDGSAYQFSKATTTTDGAPVPNAPIHLNGLWIGSTGANAYGGVALSWSDTASNEAGFIVQRSVDGQSYTTMPGMPIGADQTTYTDSSAGPDSIYFYRVCACGDSSMNYISGFADSSVQTPGVCFQVAEED